jgi:hypothetical protein
MSAAKVFTHYLLRLSLPEINLLEIKPRYALPYQYSMPSLVENLYQLALTNSVNPTSFKQTLSGK